MSLSGEIIGIDQRLQTPAGRYLVAWEQAQLDAAVADLFGYHALQLGWPAVQALRANRMPHRWLLHDRMPDVSLARLTPAPIGPDAPPVSPPLPLSVLADFEALPFPANSIDLAVLPHTLELAADPHHTLREVERVLVSEGRVVVLGFNPTSLWGAGKQAGDWAERLDWGHAALPMPSELIGPRRLRDWLRLLGFEVEYGHFGCYRPPFATQSLLDRSAWLDAAGPRWWPVFGATYMMVAVKRVRGMRLLGATRQQRRRLGAAPAVIAQREPHA